MKGATPLQVETIPCCGHHPVLERLTELRYQVVCAFCKRRSPEARSQNAARDAWNEVRSAERPARMDSLDPEVRAIITERIERGRRGLLSWQQPEAPAAAVAVPPAKPRRLQPRHDFRSAS